MYERAKKGSEIKDSQCLETDSEQKIDLSGSFWKISSRRGSGSLAITSILSQSEDFSVDNEEIHNSKQCYFRVK